MKSLKTMLAVFVVSLSNLTWAATPSEESLGKLLTVMQIRSQTESIISQVDDMIKTSAEKALNGKKLNVKEQSVIDESRAKVAAVIKEEMSWASMEPVYRKIYRESFSQEEVDSMIAFYQTPGGQAVVHKLPQVTQATMSFMQEKLAGMTPKLQKIQQDTIAKLKEQEGKKE